MMRSPGNTGEKRGRKCTNMSKKAKRILALLNDPRHRNKLVGEVNLLDQSETAGWVEAARSLRVLRS
jgi:hypothetical protein